MKATIKKVLWKDIRHEAVKCGLNKRLIEIIDDIDPNEKYPLYKACFPYGQQTVKKGKLQLPSTQGQLLPIDDPQTDPELASDLSYNHKSNPVSIILSNSMEIFLEAGHRVIPTYGIIKPGSLISTWIILNPNKPQHPPFIWDMTAGSRSTFLLPSISQRNNHERLRKEFNLKSNPPETLFDHWQIFREIACQPNFIDKHGTWHTEILYFSKHWFADFHKVKLPPQWTSFREYLLNQSWKTSEFWRNQFLWDMMFSIIQDDLKIKPNPYIVETVKQLFAIAVGFAPGFSPANTNIAGPLQGIMDVYKNIYGLTEYPPIIMQPEIFSYATEPTNSVYYSLIFPTSIAFSPRIRSRSNVADDLRQTKKLLEICINVIKTDRFNLDKIALHEIANKVKYDFFYMGRGIPEYNILPSQSIAIDPTFTAFQTYDIKNTIIPPAKSTFTSGCVRIKA